MDDSPVELEPHYRMEGFEHQRLCVLPRPQVETALGAAGTRRLLVTDAGYFPTARGHRRVRPRGCAETVVLLCVSGRGTVTIAGEAHVLTASGSIAIAAGAPHSYEASDDDPWSIWWLHVRGTDAAELAVQPLGRQSPVTRLRSMDRVVALFDELVTTLERRLSPPQLLLASGVAWNLLTRIAADSILPHEGSALERAMRYLEARVDGNIQVSELAALVGMSPSHLSALFREATGSGPAAFHTSLRMTHARNLLDTTSLSVREIAAAVGYTDPLYFSRHFRRLHGLNPTGYRALHKG
ncbi:AraC family transcriptional regulator [Microbacterium sp. W4I20]|jgi:AraC family transcriptional regulator of arabinose operon|uniref:AraC family transcriptional regulator n=1 Tax=Microbacterium sp. W4I20 TaxID=3042262 RepID=UPI00278636F5|nr:AraC family transcriptional regulator [Microbacterium sp. W4I20]MDQ0728264.1 AraC family transcriptional regulator of arabinose operon [Microbacterium sp. W4I20]